MRHDVGIKPDRITRATPPHARGDGNDPARPAWTLEPGARSLQATDI